MKSTASESSRRASRYFTSKEHLDRLLDSDTYGTVEQRRIMDVAEALRLASVRTARNAVTQPEKAR